MFIQAILWQLSQVLSEDILHAAQTRTQGNSELKTIKKQPPSSGSIWEHNGFSQKDLSQTRLDQGFQDLIIFTFRVSQMHSEF